MWIHGTVYGELTAHPVQAILDDDIAGMIGRVMEGIEVDRDSLAIELIESVGPLPGFYLNTPHTRESWKKSQYIPAAADTTNLAEWNRTGKRSAIDHAKEKMADIIKNHKVAKPLTRGQDEDIEKILSDARKYYKDKR